MTEPHYDYPVHLLDSFIQLQLPDPIFSPCLSFNYDDHMCIDTSTALPSQLPSNSTDFNLTSSTLGENSQSDMRVTCSVSET